SILCKTCGQHLPATEFYWRKNGALNSRQCKECQKKHQKERYEDPATRARIKEAQRAYYLRTNGKDRERRIPSGRTAKE
ncbi:hypothetical protein, partial [Salmonella sp. SAL4360]|uniref:hypothetical protein n=1 Tax=Salmonella sp. SAL4360 TaxID=3159881 RepID=UPI00397A5B04